MRAFRGVLLVATAALCLDAKEAFACGCCDGESQITPIGWARLGRELLLRHEDRRGCERRATVEVYPLGRNEPSACHDLLASPEQRLPCARATAHHEKPLAKFTGYHEPVVGISTLDFSARYRVRADGAFRKAEIEVFLLGNDTPLARIPAHEYEYTPPGGDGTPVVFPLEVAILPSLDQPHRAVVIARGMDENPGIGHRGFRLKWVELPRAIARKPGVSWVRALPRFSSPKPDLPEGTAVRANGAGVALLAQGRLSEALGKFEAALVADPAHVLARYNLACALARQGAPSPAIEQLIELLGEAPEPARTERRNRARVDPDLEPLRENVKFEDVVCGGECPPVSADGSSASQGARAPLHAESTSSSGATRAAIVPSSGSHARVGGSATRKESCWVSTVGGASLRLCPSAIAIVLAVALLATRRRFQRP